MIAHVPQPRHEHQPNKDSHDAQHRHAFQRVMQSPNDGAIHHPSSSLTLRSLAGMVTVLTQASKKRQGASCPCSVTPRHAMLAAMSVALHQPITLAEFLAWQRQQALRFEFDSFAPVAMTGGTIADGTLLTQAI